MVCSPDISMSYNVITSKHHSERMAETGTLFKGQQWDNKSGWGGTEKCQTSDLMLLSKYKRRPDALNKHVVLYLESEATSLSADTAHPFRLIPWLLELDSSSRTWLRDFTFTFHFHALKKEMATHSSVLAWRIPGTGEPDGLPSVGSHRVGHDWSDLAAAAA